MASKRDRGHKQVSAEPFCTEIKHSDWMLQFAGLFLTNQSSLSQHCIMLQVHYDISLNSNVTKSSFLPSPIYGMQGLAAAKFEGSLTMTSQITIVEPLQHWSQHLLLLYFLAPTDGNINYTYTGDLMATYTYVARQVGRHW